MILAAVLPALIFLFGIFATGAVAVRDPFELMLCAVVAMVVGGVVVAFWPRRDDRLLPPSRS